MALMTVSAASAANIAPNPGFEVDANSDGQPDGWTPVDGTPVRDTTQHHSGVASYKLTPANNSQSTAHTDCINSGLPSGANAVGYWYRALPGITGLAMTVSAYSSAGCTGGIALANGGSFQVASINTSGNWTLYTATMNLPSAAASFRITLADGCSSGCPGTQAAWFDDIAVGAAPTTAVTLASLGATRTPQGVRVAWKVASANGVAGYNVYRAGQKLNRGLIVSKGSLSLGTYSWLDRAASKTGRITYRLQIVKLDGTRAWLGTATVRSCSKSV
jgi:hypothetical protein